MLARLPSVIDDISRSKSQIVLDSSFNIADQAEQLRILKEVLEEYNIDLKQSNLKPNQVLNAIGRCKAMLFHGENPFPDGNKKKRISPAMAIATKVYYACREKLLSSNCIDFDDLIYLTRELLLVSEVTRDRLKRRWTHVLVDEFQDTSQTQMDLVKLLTSSSLFVVGDADQSIYSWRGANAGSLSDFENAYKGLHVEGVSTVYLMENYRYEIADSISWSASHVVSLP
jgi:superfamily I DNA/RNA helicase